MKGFSKEETEMLLSEAKAAKKSGVSLTEVFESVAKKTGRARGSVRNYYYHLLGGERKSELEKSGLKAEKIVAFSKEEEDKLIREVLGGVRSGKSVRRAIIDLSDGDGKLALRMQNKYRNLVKNSPEEVESVAREMNFSDGRFRVIRRKTDLSPYIKKVSDEIDNLVQRIKDKYRLENDALKAENASLKAELDALKDKISPTTLSEFFGGGNKVIM